MVGGFVLGALKVVHRVVKKSVIAFNTAIGGVCETGDANGLVAGVLRLLRSDQVNLAAHLHAVVKSVHRVAAVVLSGSMDLPLVDCATIESTRQI